jgi:hypothetical protein
MLPLLGEMLSKGHGRSSMAFMSACVVTTQVVVAGLASWSGIKAGEWGRKPLLLTAFAASGSIAHRCGYHAGLLFLAVVASTAFTILFFFMPETRIGRQR